MPDSERASLAWLAGFEVHTVENIAAVITRVRETRYHDVRFAPYR